MRIAVYTDYEYTRVGERVYADRAFALFLAALSRQLERIVIVGRMRPSGERPRYELPASGGFVPLPHYEKLSRPLRVVSALIRSLPRFWRALDDVDACWLLGPHPLAIAFSVLARIRGRAVVLGVREHLIEYVGSRHPGRRSLLLAARILDAAYRLLARRHPVVVVGPALAHRYRHAPDLLEIAVSLIAADQIPASASALGRDYAGERRLLAVGRIEAEKNPLALAEVLARLVRDDDSDWRLIVCGEGEMTAELSARLAERGVADRAELRGYVPHAELPAIYRSSHVLVHTSWTEGFPQVIVEALAAGLPVVATDVGGIREAVGDAVVLVPPGDVEAIAGAVREICSQIESRNCLVEAGLAYARAHTLEEETRRVAAFLSRVGQGPPLSRAG